MTTSTSLYKYSHTLADRPHPADDPLADERRRHPDAWACLRDTRGRDHFINRKEVDMIRVLTSAAYGWTEVGGAK